MSIVSPSAEQPKRTSTVTVEVVLPAHNEAPTLERSVRTLRRYLDEQFPFTARVTVADNASSDETWNVASRLAAGLPGVRAVHLDAKGRGRALKTAWLESDAEIVAYMDVDLSTDLDAMLPLVAPLLSGHSDLAIGSRLALGAHVVRGPRREVISRAYNFLTRRVLGHRFTDAQCGFKAIRADVAQSLLPLISDTGWFFDTELLILAEHNGLRIHEVPVDWVDDPDSRVDILRTAMGDLRGLWRVSRQVMSGQGWVEAPRRDREAAEAVMAARFAGVGGVSTLAYLVLFLVLQLGLDRLVASAVALTVTAAANAAAHWHYTLAPGDDRTRRGRAKELLRVSCFAWAAGLALNAAALAAARLVSGSLLTALVALVAANVVVSAGRFLAVRAAAFRTSLERGVS